MKSEENHGCRHCVKSFSSQKALYGHMRLHSDRPWRGMQPPSSALVESSRPLPCWIVTAKRGRTTISTDASSSTSSSGTSSNGSELAVNDMPVQHHSKMKKIKKDQLKSSVFLDSVISANHEHQAQLKNVNCHKKLYRCNSCDKEFTSHQALGGHKSGHNKRMTVSSLTEQKPTQRRKILDFDLNELPPMDKEE